MPQFTLAKVKTFIGNEGHGLNAEITMDGAAVAFVLDEATGGMLQVDWFTMQGRQRSRGNDAARAELLQHARAEYEREGGDAAHESRRKEMGLWFEGCGLSQRSDHDMIEHWVNEEFARVVALRNLKRWAKTKTVFRLKGDKDGEYRTLSKPYGAGVVQVLKGKYGESLDFVFNPAMPALQGIS